MKTVNHKNIWSQRTLEHHLYFQVWANTCICFVFFSFGGVFVFVRFVVFFFFLNL